MRWNITAHFGVVNMLLTDPGSGILYSVKGHELKKWNIMVSNHLQYKFLLYLCWFLTAEHTTNFTLNLKVTRLGV